MIMRIKAILAFVLLVVCGPVNAAEPSARGAYIGGGFGESMFDDGGAFAFSSFDDRDKSLQVHGGYKILKHLAIEARYVDFGTFSLQPIDFDVTAISIHAVGIIPFGESGWELFGQLGLGTVTFDITGFGDEDQTAGAGGIGVRYSPTPNFSVGIQTDAYVWEDDSLGPTYDMAVGGTQLTFQFIF
jgi:hypothetical protein